MAEEQKVFSLDEIRKNRKGGTKYNTFECYGGMLRIGSLSSKDMLEWLEANDDPVKKVWAGLRLLTKSIVDADGERFPEEDWDAIVTEFTQKDAKQNGIGVSECLKLNGFDRKAREVLKNALGEAPTDASPTASPSSSDTPASTASSSQ